MMQKTDRLVLEVLKEPEAVKLSIFAQTEIASTLRHYSQRTVSFREINRLCEETTAALNKIDRYSHSEPDLIKGLKKTGQLLWDHLLTRQVKERLENTTSALLVLSLDEELIHIPWELLYDGSNFLCLKFSLGRLVRTKEEASLPQYRGINSPVRMLIIANPTGDLKSAYLEGIQIKNQFDKRRKQIQIDSKTTSVDTLYLKKNLHDYDIVHFAGHCEYDQKNPKDSGWVLSDGRLNIADILVLGQTVPLPSLVFSNACHSAETPADTVDFDYQGKTYSLAQAFLFSGVKHYIGTTRKIEDQSSLSFAKGFYTHMLEGLSIGECLRLSRLGLLKEYGLEKISWANYLLYGDPNFVLFRPKTKTLVSNRPRKFVLPKKLLLRVLLTTSAISILIYLYIWLPTLNPNTYLLFAQSRKLFLKGNNQEAISLCTRLINQDPQFLKAYPLLGDTYQRIGNKNEALKYYFAYALQSERQKDKKNLASAYTGIGWVYHLYGEYARAFDFYNKAITLARENKDKLREARALERLAIWYIDKEDNDKALELLMKSSAINRERQHILEHRYGLACDYFDIALVYTNKDDFDAAKEFYSKSRRIFEGLKMRYELSDYYFNLGEICLFEKQYQKALDYYMQGLRIDEQEGHKLNLASDYNMLGELYVEMDNLEEAEKFFHQAVALAKEINAPVELVSAYHDLGLLYKHKRLKAKAREYLRLAQEISRRIDTPTFQEIKEELLSLDQ